MVLDRKHFDLLDKCVIEKILIKAPFRHGVIFENEACFIMIKNGEGNLKSPNEAMNITVSEGVLLKCGSYFTDFIKQTDNQNCELIAIHLPKDLLRSIFKDESPSFFKPTDTSNYAQKILNREIVFHYMGSLDFYFRHPTLVNDELLILKLKELIILLIQTNHAEDILGLFAHLFTPRQASLKEIIQTHLLSNLSISELATLSGRSLSSFKRDFEATFHASPAKYIREQRLLKASYWLISSDLSISKICYKIGFENTSHFSKLFKKKYRVGPLEYRNAATKK